MSKTRIEKKINVIWEMTNHVNYPEEQYKIALARMDKLREIRAKIEALEAEAEAI